MDRRHAMLLGSLLLCTFTQQVWCQMCSSPCHCPRPAPRCPPGVPLVLDGCRCCQVCGGQEGEACTERYVCDSQRGLQCDYSASYPGGPGECVSQNELGCELNGMRFEEGQTFQPSCAQLCHCLGGGVTCVPRCSDDLHPPAANCPNPQLLRLPGRCCKEWVCDSLDNNIYPEPFTGPVDRTERLRHEGPVERTERLRQQDFGAGPSPGQLSSNCMEQNADWSPCSRTCGPGVSTHTSNNNWACRPHTQTRLCQVRTCQAAAPPRRPQAATPGACESSYRSPVPIRLEHQGCLSALAYRPRFCGLPCPDGRCCSPYRTRTVRMFFLCPQGRMTLHQVMVIESCSCHHHHSCPQAPPGTSRRALPWL